LVERGVGVVWNDTQSHRLLDVLNVVTKPSLNLDLGRSFHARITLPEVPHLSFKFVPETLIHKAGKWIRDEPEVGDLIFDKRVYVRTETPDELRKYLAEDGVQSSILSLFSNVVANNKTNSVSLLGSVLEVCVHKAERQDIFNEQKLKLDVVGLILPLLNSEP